MTVCETKSVYGSIAIHNVLTESVVLKTEYDAANVDPVGINTAVTFTGELHTSDAVQQDIGARVNWGRPGGQGLAPGLHDVIREFLRPRQRFLYTINDEIWFEISPDATAACSEPEGKRMQEGGGSPNTEINHTASLGMIVGNDIAHGPRTTCQVLAVKGAYSAKCRFTVEFTTPIQCESSSSDIRDILNIRWVVADNIDFTTGLTRRMFRGRIRYRSRSGAFNTHVLARNFAFPPLGRGFRRERVGYHEEPNALELSFDVEDQEVWANAPAPATFWDGTYTMSFPQNGTACEQQFSVTLKADKAISKQRLATLAMYCFEAKTHWEWLRTNAPGSIFLLSTMLQESLADNEIRFEARVISHDANAWLANMRSFKNGVFEFGRPLPPDVSRWNRGVTNPRDRDYDKEEAVLPEKLTAPVVSLLNMLQNPCCIATLNTTRGTTECRDISSAASSPAAYTPTAIPYSQARYSDSHNKAAYQFYRMSSEIVTDTGWRAFPIGRQCSTGTEASVAFSHMHCPVQIRKVTIHANRINAWPEIIKPVHWQDPQTTIKHVLKDYSIEPLPIQLSADGRDAMHEIIATYWYYLDRPYTVGTSYKWPVGILPYVTPADISVGMITSDGVDSDGSAIDQQFFLAPALLLAGVD